MRTLPLLLATACAAVDTDDVASPDGSEVDTDAVLPPEPPPGCLPALCDDGDPCNGSEACEDDVCVPGEPVACDDGLACVVVDGAPACAAGCDVPTAPVLGVLRDDEVLTFALPGGGTDGLRVAVGEAGWTAGPTLGFAGLAGPTRVRAAGPDDACDVFDVTYDVRPSYPGAAGTPGSQAVSKEAPVAWATSVAEVAWGANVTEAWRVAERALGPAAGTSADVASLGEGGAIVLAFDAPIPDGPGPDLAVFENGFRDDYLELAFVEVSSDGAAFARFDAAARETLPKGPFDLMDPTMYHGLAGTVRQGFGVPFDLAHLRQAEAVRRGLVDLAAVRFVRVVDVVGDGTARDSFGRPVLDPTPTTGSAGFDVDAVGVLHAR